MRMVKISSALLASSRVMRRRLRFGAPSENEADCEKGKKQLFHDRLLFENGMVFADSQTRCMAAVGAAISRPKRSSF